MSFGFAISEVFANWPLCHLHLSLWVPFSVIVPDAPVMCSANLSSCKQTPNLLEKCNFVHFEMQEHRPGFLAKKAALLAG